MYDKKLNVRQIIEPFAATTMTKKQQQQQQFKELEARCSRLKKR